MMSYFDISCFRIETWFSVLWWTKTTGGCVARVEWPATLKSKLGLWKTLRSSGAQTATGWAGNSVQSQLILIWNERIWQHFGWPSKRSSVLKRWGPLSAAMTDAPPQQKSAVAAWCSCKTRSSLIASILRQPTVFSMFLLDCSQCWTQSEPRFWLSEISSFSKQPKDYTALFITHWVRLFRENFICLLIKFTWIALAIANVCMLASQHSSKSIATLGAKYRRD